MTRFSKARNGYGCHLTGMQKLDAVNREIIIELQRAINAHQQVLDKFKAWNAVKGKLIASI